MTCDYEIWSSQERFGSDLFVVCMVNTSSQAQWKRSVGDKISPLSTGSYTRISCINLQLICAVLWVLECWGNDAPAKCLPGM